MSQETFQKTHEKTWKAFEEMLDAMEKSPGKKRLDNEENFPKLYRQLCHHLDLARNRNYGSQLSDKLNQLTLRGHQYFYEAHSSRSTNFKKLFTRDFPQAVRRDWRFFLLASLLFYGPFFGMICLIKAKPDMVYAVLDISMVESISGQYSDKSVAEESGMNDKLYSFGHYIYNNTGIGLRVFGTSLILGVGTFFTLIFNGVFIGAVFGHLYVDGLGHNLLPFVIGHGSFELTAIVISGMAGLKLGLSLVKPGNLTRRESLLFTARESMPLVYGFVTMFFIAAFIEAFWSGTAALPKDVKYIVGMCLWLLVASYFCFVGRRVR